MSIWLIALFNVVSIAMLVASVLAGLLAAWWMFPVGLLFYIVMALMIVRDPANRMTQILQQRAPLTQRFQAPFQRIQRTQVQLFNLLSTDGKGFSQAMDPVKIAVDELVNSIYGICQRLTPLENYRRSSEITANPANDLKDLNNKLASSQDPNTRKQYEDAKQALEERMQNMNLAVNQLNQLDAKLLGVANDLDTTLSEILQLKAVPLDQAKLRVPILEQKVRGEIFDLAKFEQESLQK